MSLAAEIASAAQTAQAVLAELGGAQPGKKNSLYNGTPYTAVYGQPQVERTMLPSGGYRQRTIVPLTVTRAQFAAPPVSEKKWTRTDCSPALEYIIKYVGTHDSTVFMLQLVRVGE